MSGYDSPLGKKNFNSQPLKEFDVPHEDEYPYKRNSLPQMPDMASLNSFTQQMSEDSEQQLADVERQVKIDRQSKASGKIRLNEGAKRRIEMLIGMSRLTKDVLIDGKTFSLRTLSSKEAREVIIACSEFDGTIQFVFEIRRQTLAMSLIKIEGIDIANFLGVVDASKLKDYSLELIDSLEEALLLRLYNEYNKLSQESTEKFSIKNEFDSKEVVEDLKK